MEDNLTSVSQASPATDVKKISFLKPNNKAVLVWPLHQSVQQDSISVFELDEIVWINHKPLLAT